MESLLKKELGTTKLKQFGGCGGGCISRGNGYDTDQGKIFAKFNSESGARVMFDGEFAGLETISATQTVRVPKPIKVFDDPSGGAVLVMEYLDIRGLNKYNADLGEKLARLHLHNAEMKKKAEGQASSVHKDDVQYVDKFGFHTATCCGYIPQDNSWQDNWVTFFTKQKLQQQVDLILQKSGDRDVKECWPKLVRKIPEYFKGIENEIVPALLHGDLWGGNAAETDEGPVIFDCAAFYGHSEFELGIATMFGGFGRDFFDSYHQMIPVAPGQRERVKLYQLFHYLNHWNHFGSGYKGSSMSIMKELSK
ncbi:ketosamine-3-kinase-like isoform X2 [Lineus longissimus]